MIFLNFSQLRKVFSFQIFQENTFLKIKPNFSLTEKYFLLTNFSNDKQTLEYLESGFSKIIFRETNITQITQSCLSISSIIFSSL